MTLANLQYNPPKAGTGQRPIARPPSETEPEPDQHLIAGRYRTQSRIGRGRLGEIFAAVDTGCEKIGVEQQVAIQVIPQNIVGNNTLFNKINMGYTVLSANGHPNIVSFGQFGRDAGSGYVAMELLEGTSLRLVLDDAEFLPLSEAKPVIRGVGEALRFLHAKEMVHGNLTTGNVFITGELEVRLLDVVPLDSADAIFRGNLMSEPFSHCTIEDDVFGLACLTYEMLSGKHPFNYSSPEEARLAGLEAARIDALSDQEWNALRLALSFDREERTPSVAEFMRDFDIAGTERLRPTGYEPAAFEHVTYPAAGDTASLTQEEIPAQNIVTAAAVKNIGMVSLNEQWPTDAIPKRTATRPLRAVLLATLLASLVAWSYYGQPEEQLAQVIAYADESLDIGLLDSGDGVVNAWITEPDGQVLANRDVPVNTPSIAESEASIEAALTETDEIVAAAETTNTVEENVAAVQDAGIQPVSAEMLADDNSAATVDEATGDKANEVLAAADVDSARVESTAVVVDPFVSVSERDAAARIEIEYDASSTTQLAWWTSEYTANADQDFVDVKQRILTAALLEDGNIIHVPLINDGVPEPRESFYVNLGRLNTDRQRIELVATVRVDIIDDDGP